MIFTCWYGSFHPQRLILESYLILRLTFIYKQLWSFHWKHVLFFLMSAAFLTYYSYSCSFRTHQQKEPNTTCVNYCSMRQSPETAFYFLSVYLVDKSKHSSNNQKVMASFLRVNKVLQVNLQKEQQILLKQIYSIYAD